MVSPPRQLTSCSFQGSLRQCLHRLTCFIVLARLGFWNTRVIRGCGPCPKSRPFRRSPARPGPWRTSASLDHHAESELCSWLGTWTAGICVCWDRWPLQCDCTKTTFVERLPHHAQSMVLRVTTPTSLRLSLALAMVVTIHARRFQRTHPLSDMGSLLNVSKDTGM